MPASAEASEIISSIALISLCMNCVRSNPTYCAVSEILFTPIPLFSRFFISFSYFESRSSTSASWYSYFLKVFFGLFL